jgi:hypothetical protein
MDRLEKFFEYEFFSQDNLNDHLDKVNLKIKKFQKEENYLFYTVDTVLCAEAGYLTKITFYGYVSRLTFYE